MAKKSKDAVYPVRVPRALYEEAKAWDINPSQAFRCTLEKEIIKKILDDNSKPMTVNRTLNADGSTTIVIKVE